MGSFLLCLSWLSSNCIQIELNKADGCFWTTSSLFNRQTLNSHSWIWTTPRTQCYFYSSTLKMHFIHSKIMLHLQALAGGGFDLSPLSLLKSTARGCVSALWKGHSSVDFHGLLKSPPQTRSCYDDRVWRADTITVYYRLNVSFSERWWSF